MPGKFEDLEQLTPTDQTETLTESAPNASQADEAWTWTGFGFKVLLFIEFGLRVWA